MAHQWPAARLSAPREVCAKLPGMPSLEWNRQWGEAFRKFKERHPDELYGNEWGDPELRGWRYALHRLWRRGVSPGPLHKVVDRYIRPYLMPMRSSSRSDAAAAAGPATSSARGN